MIDIIVVVGVSVILTDYTKAKIKLLKNYKDTSILLPIISTLICGALNTLNAFVFGGVVLLALKTGIEFGALASGIYAIAKRKLEQKEGGK